MSRRTFHHCIVCGVSKIEPVEAFAVSIQLALCRELADQLLV